MALLLIEGTCFSGTVRFFSEELASNFHLALFIGSKAFSSSDLHRRVLMKLCLLFISLERNMTYSVLFFVSLFSLSFQLHFAYMPFPIWFSISSLWRYQTLLRHNNGTISTNTYNRIGNNSFS